MPPKKEAPAAAAAPAGPAYTPEQQAERLELIEECKRLRDLKLSEQSEFAMLSETKSKINALWAASKKQLEDTRAEFRDKERQKTELIEEQAAEIKLHKQRIKHMLFEHQSESVDKQVDGKVVLKTTQEAQADDERELKADMRDLKVVLKELETSHEDLARALKLEADKGITALRLEFEREARELQAAHEDKMLRVREDLSKTAEDDIRSIEKRKTIQIRALIASHEKAFGDVKLYYNEITHSNLDLIKSLKEEVDDLRKKEAGDERVMYSIATENKKMSEPLRKALEQVRTLKVARDAYRADISALHETKAAILVVQDRLENLRWEHEILQQRFDLLVGERDTLYDRFSRALHEVKQKAGFKALVLEERVVVASEAASRAGTMLKEVVSAAGVTGGVSENATAGAKALGVQVAAKDAIINALRGELERVAAAHDDLMRSCLDAMHANDVPASEFGFVPLTAREILTTGIPAPLGGNTMKGAGGGGGQK